MRRLPFQAFLSHDVYNVAKPVLFHLTEPLDEKKKHMRTCHKNKNVTQNEKKRTTKKNQ